MTTLKQLLNLVATLGVGSTSLVAADFFSEDFNASSLATPLIVPTLYSSGSNATPNGSLQNVVFTDFREFVRTSATDYNTVDFQMDITVSVSGSNPSQTAFVGIGSAIPDPNYFTEPHTSIYMRLFPDDFLNGSLGLTITPDASSHVESILSNPPHPGAGEHRVRIRKQGNLLTFGVDADYAGADFIADYSVTKQMDVDLPFLNGSNSGLFFGVQGPGTTFDNLQIKRVSVPDQGIGFGVTSIVIGFMAASRARNRG